MVIIVRRYALAMFENVTQTAHVVVGAITVILGAIIQPCLALMRTKLKTMPLVGGYNMWPALHAMLGHVSIWMGWISIVLGLIAIREVEGLEDQYFVGALAAVATLYFAEVALFVWSILQPKRFDGPNHTKRDVDFVEVKLRITDESLPVKRHRTRPRVEI